LSQRLTTVRQKLFVGYYRILCAVAPSASPIGQDDVVMLASLTTRNVKHRTSLLSEMKSNKLIQWNEVSPRLRSGMRLIASHNGGNARGACGILADEII
jgi:hypothetical protein